MTLLAISLLIMWLSVIGISVAGVKLIREIEDMNKRVEKLQKQVEEWKLLSRL